MSFDGHGCFGGHVLVLGIKEPRAFERWPRFPSKWDVPPYQTTPLQMNLTLKPSFFVSFEPTLGSLWPKQVTKQLKGSKPTKSKVHELSEDPSVHLGRTSRARRTHGLTARLASRIDFLPGRFRAMDPAMAVKRPSAMMAMRSDKMSASKRNGS